MKRANLDALRSFLHNSNLWDSEFARYFFEAQPLERPSIIRAEYDDWGCYNKGTILVDGKEMGIPKWGELSHKERSALTYYAHDIALNNLKLPVQKTLKTKQ
jgi:hypothetical protein